MDIFADPKNPYASFGRPRFEETVEEENPALIEPLQNVPFYEVRLLGVLKGWVLNAPCILERKGDVLYFHIRKKTLSYTRKEILEMSARKVVFRYRPPCLLIWFSLLNNFEFHLNDSSDNIIELAKLFAWSKTHSDNEMESIVKKEISRLCWRCTWSFSWIPMIVAFSFACLALAVKGWIGAFGPLHGFALVFIGWVIALFWQNTRGAAALPTGCFSCGVDYAVNSFYALDPDTVFAYRFFAGLMFFFGLLCSTPILYNKNYQRLFAEQLRCAIDVVAVQIPINEVADDDAY